jgi:malectin (di-glucose binding ER protein)
MPRRPNWPIRLSTTSSFRAAAATPAVQASAWLPGATGDILWVSGYSGFMSLIVEGDAFYVHDTKNDLLTGKLLTRGLYRSTKGCGGMIGSTNLLTFRSSTLAYTDLTTGAGTTNFGGARAGCTESLIAADGVLCAPNLAYGCGCGYPIYTSLALVNMPEAEAWTYSRWPRGLPLGVNLGAPGSRTSTAGTAWAEFPPRDFELKRSVQTAPENVEWFTHHSVTMEAGALKWVTASGGIGLTSLEVELPTDEPPASYTVRLHFSDPEDVKPGARVFSVAIQGNQVLKDLDVVREAGGPRRSLVREFKGVKATEKLQVALSASRGKTLLCGVEVLAEVTEE